MTHPTNKQQLALAILLLKDFKCDGKFDLQVIKFCFELAQSIDVVKEYNELMSQVPVMKIVPR